MRLSRINKNYKDFAESETLDIYMDSTDYEDDLSIFEHDNKKKLTSYVLNIKQLVRRSLEYSSLMLFLKNYGGMGICGVHPNIKHDEGFSIEIHHTPFVMEDIIYTVLRKRFLSNEDIKMGSVAKEIMLLHYVGVIGLYPLCETCHDYAHDDDTDLFIPLSKVYGEPDKFFEMYKKYMKKELVSIYETYLKLNRGLDIIENNLPPSLIKKYIYINNIDNEHMISTKRLINFINDTST